METHPLKKDKKSALWINLEGVSKREPMKYGVANSMLRRAFKKAGVNKKCNPHLFRHSRATLLANHLTEFQMNQYFGWKQGSDMPATYVHMSGRDLDDAICKMNGIKQDKEQNKVMQPKVCQRCGTMNKPDSRYCYKCASVLDLDELMRQDQMQLDKQKHARIADNLISNLLNDPDIGVLLKEKIAKMELQL